MCRGGDPDEWWSGWVEEAGLRAVTSSHWDERPPEEGVSMGSGVVGSRSMVVKEGKPDVVYTLGVHFGC